MLIYLGMQLNCMQFNFSTGNKMRHGLGLEKIVSELKEKGIYFEFIPPSSWNQVKINIT